MQQLLMTVQGQVNLHLLLGEEPAEPLHTHIVHLPGDALVHAVLHRHCHGADVANLLWVSPETET